MLTKRPAMIFIAVLLMVAAGLIGPDTGFAHCDGLDGPVVKAAKEALESGNPNLVLIWVQKSGEAEIKEAFRNTLAVRKLNPQAKELADMYFFETLVRVHRAGEGEPYTGLKPAGRDLGPAIPMADRALENGNLESLLRLLSDDMQRAVRARFEDTVAKKDYRANNVEAGREYVETYVLFLEQAERIHQAANSPVRGHVEESGKAALQEEKH